MLSACEALSAEYAAREIIFQFSTERGAREEIYHHKSRERTRRVPGFGVTLQWKAGAINRPLAGDLLAAVQQAPCSEYAKTPQ